MTQEERSEETRGRILAAAAESFARQGYDVTSVDAICRLAGVSKGAFYHHFATKQALFLALLNDWLEGLDEQIQSILFTAPDIAEGLVRLSVGLEDIADLLADIEQALAHCVKRAPASKPATHSA